MNIWAYLIGIMSCLVLAACSSGGASSSLVGQAPTPETASAEKAEAPRGPFSGRCYCGAVVYEIDGPILEHNFCNCASCRKAHGALKVPWIVVAGENFHLKKGELKQYREKENPQGCDCHGTRNFCPHCGGQVFWQRDHGAKVDVCAMTLDDMSAFRGKE